MKFFVDSADTNAVRKCLYTGLVDGVTTNPSLAAKAGRDYFQLLQEMSSIVDGPISAEVTAADTPGMLRQATKLLEIGTNIVIKLPMSWAGLNACQTLTRQGARTNVTLCFSVLQAIAAARSGATYVSPFVGRIDDTGHDGMALIEEITKAFQHYGFSTQVLAASVRSTVHIRGCALAGAHVVTLPPELLQSMISHPLTTTGIEQFNIDWASTGQTLPE